MLSVDGTVLQVVQGQEVLSQILVDGVFAGELGAQIGGAGQKFGGLRIYFGTVVFDPQNFGGDVGGADGVAKQPFRLIAEMFVQPGDLFMAAGIYSVKDSVAQGGAVLVHRDAVAAQRGEPDASDQCRVDAAVGQDLPGQAAEAAPPVLLSIVLEPARLGVHQGMGLAGEGDESALFVNQRSFALIGAYVDAQKIHIFNPF